MEQFKIITNGATAVAYSADNGLVAVGDAQDVAAQVLARVGVQVVHVDGIPPRQVCPESGGLLWAESSVIACRCGAQVPVSADDGGRREIRKVPVHESQAAAVRVYTYSQVNPGGADVSHDQTFTGTAQAWAEHLVVKSYEGAEVYNARSLPAGT